MHIGPCTLGDHILGLGEVRRAARATSSRSWCHASTVRGLTLGRREQRPPLSIGNAMGLAWHHRAKKWSLVLSTEALEPENLFTLEWQCCSATLGPGRARSWVQRAKQGVSKKMSKGGSAADTRSNQGKLRGALLILLPPTWEMSFPPPSRNPHSQKIFPKLNPDS